MSLPCILASTQKRDAPPVLRRVECPGGRAGAPARHARTARTGCDDPEPRPINARGLGFWASTLPPARQPFGSWSARMLTDIPLIGPVKVVLLATLTTLGASGRRRPPVPVHGARWQVARRAAQVAAADPQLERELRRVTRRIACLAIALEGELRRFRPLEQRFEQVAGHVDDEVFERLAERFGVLGVRPALQRLQDVHPDAAGDDEG